MLTSLCMVMQRSLPLVGSILPSVFPRTSINRSPLWYLSLSTCCIPPVLYESHANSVSSLPLCPWLRRGRVSVSKNNADFRNRLVMLNKTELYQYPRFNSQINMRKSSYLKEHLQEVSIPLEWMMGVKKRTLQWLTLESNFIFSEDLKSVAKFLKSEY